MERRNTIQKGLILNAVQQMKHHSTADEVYEYVKKDYPSIGKGTVYRNLTILAEEGKIRKIEIPDGADCFDYILKEHYHVRCIRCNQLFDVEMQLEENLMNRISDNHGIQFLSYDILFKGVCPECLKLKEVDNEQEGDV